jgi:hypothetical protein
MTRPGEFALKQSCVEGARCWSHLPDFIALQTIPVYGTDEREEKRGLLRIGALPGSRLAAHDPSSRA